jgi:hypothetical protein
MLQNLVAWVQLRRRNVACVALHILALARVTMPVSAHGHTDCLGRKRVVVADAQGPLPQLRI